MAVKSKVFCIEILLEKKHLKIRRCGSSPEAIVQQDAAPGICRAG
jgi:hypothetical protein